MSFCGYVIHIHPRSESGIAPSVPGNLNEEEAIRYYFHRGFEYKVILKLLSKYRGVSMSSRILSYHLNELDLTRRHTPGEIDKARVTHLIRQELSEDGCLLGYRAMWRALKRKYRVNMSRRVVQMLIGEIGPNGTNERRSHKLNLNN